MLQIISGKFYKSDSVKETDGKGIFYSNFHWASPIETCIVTLEPVDGYSTSIASYTLSYKNKVEIDPNAKAARLTYPEIIPQFQALCIFGLKSFFDVDRTYVELLCRKNPKSAAESFVPSNFVPNFFNESIHGNLDDIENFKSFIDKIIGLPREQYKGIMNSITAFSQALQILNYNLDLAYSLMIYALESLSQRFDNFEPIWDDYDHSARKKLDGLFKKEEMKPETINSMKQILLESSNLRLMKRFIEFTSSNVKDSFFKEEAEGLKNPLRKSELKQALKNAYRMRSGYVHALEEIEISLKYPQFGGESIRWENNPYLTFEGLTRLTHHVILNYVNKQDYIETEDYDWTQDVPGRIDVNIHPKHWIWDERIFQPSDINVTFSGYLTLLYDSLMFNEPIVDLRKLMLKIEKLIENGVKNEYKYPMLSFYFLYNYRMSDEFKSPNYSSFIQNHMNHIYEPNITNMIVILLINKKWPWDIEKSVQHYWNYRKNKFYRNSLNIPRIFEVFILIDIANRFLEEKNVEEYKKWLDMAMLELSGEFKCQTVIEEYKTKEKTIIIWDTLKECLNDNNDSKD